MTDRAPNLPAVEVEPTADDAPIAPARPRAPRRAARGHAPKILAALRELDAAGLLPPHLRPCTIYTLVCRQLTIAGYALDMPGRDAVRRAYGLYRPARA
jgi:hypothetical protein